MYTCKKFLLELQTADTFTFSRQAFIYSAQGCGPAVDYLKPAMVREEIPAAKWVSCPFKQTSYLVYLVGRKHGVEKCTVESVKMI